MALTNLVGQTILGYTVTERIHSGAFGTVYKVEKTNPSGRYIRALKHITIPTEKQYLSILNSMGGDISKADSYFEKMLNDIVSEIRILNDLSEKGAEHIVRYYENDITMSESPKRYDVYILMEFLMPLEDYLTANEFAVRDVLKLAFDVLEGLKICHANGVWHRDIKDGNIFVTNSGGYKIGDFGVSKVLKDSERVESLKGTPDFLAPEVYLGKSGYTETVDLYSLGIVLYRLLNHGRNPFLPKFPEQYFSKDEDAAFEKRMMGAVPEPPALGGEKVGTVILKAIASKEERYQTAEAFARDLERAVQDFDRELLTQSVKAKMSDEISAGNQTMGKVYGETIGATMAGVPGTSFSGVSEMGGENSSSINRHLFDTIGETPVFRTEASVEPLHFESDRGDSASISGSSRQGQSQELSRSYERTNQRVAERAPVVSEPAAPEAIDRTVISKVVFAVPIGLVLVAIIAYFMVIPGIYGKVISFFDWLYGDPENIIAALRDPAIAVSKANYIVMIRVFWYVWLVGFIISLFFVGKQFQKKPEPNTANTILVKREPYLLAQDIHQAIKLEYQKNKCSEIQALLNEIKWLEERMSVESDFGYGGNAVIHCENNIARQLQYLLDFIPYVSTGNMKENIGELNKAVSNIKSLLRRRTEMKKR